MSVAILYIIYREKWVYISYQAQKQGCYLSILGLGPCTQPDRDPDGPLGRLYRCERGHGRSVVWGEKGGAGVWEDKGNFVVGLVVVGLVLC